MSGTKPDPMVRAPQKDPNLKKCVSCDGSLLPVSASRVRRDREKIEQHQLSPYFPLMHYVDK